MIIEENESIDKKLTAFYENLILNLYIKRKRKFANLILANFFIYEEFNYYLMSQIFFETPLLKKIFQSQKNALKFFEFTYISKSKIANSCLICIYIYLTKVAEVEEEIAFKFTDEIRKEFFKEDAVQKLLRSNLNSQIYCDGIYNSTPIFHWYTPKDKKFYLEEDLEEYINAYEKGIKEMGSFKKSFFKFFSIKENTLSKKDILEKVLLNLCESYVRNPNKIIAIILKQNQKKKLRYYLNYPIRVLRTILIYLNTK